MSFKILYEDTDFVVISKLKHTTKEQLEILRNVINGVIHIMENIDNDDTMSSPVVSQNSIEEMLKDAMVTNDTCKIKCIHCNMMLSCGYDKNNMMHCQSCHNIWDGFAQCNCY